MPRGDRTGPWGLGPRTGRRAGFCSGFSVPGYMNPVPGRGWGGRGLGWGRMAWSAPTASPFSAIPAEPATNASEEVELLKQEAEALRQALASIENRLKELGKK